MLRRFLIVAGVCVIFSIACKQRGRRSGVKDTGGANASRSTTETLRYLRDTAKTDSFKFEINMTAFNEEFSEDVSKIKKPAEYFGRPYKEIQNCSDEEKAVYGGACMGWDNQMTYVYNPDGEAERKDRGGGYNNIIPMRVGDAQPEIEEFMRPGDIISFYHPERRRSALGGEEMQWRSTHAATIVRKNGKITTADTPAGYAKPFNGNDPTPFHVFRIMPKDAEGNDLPEALADKYRENIAKWASLGFDQFQFTGAYDSAAGELHNPDSITKFGNLFLQAATQGAAVPKMYCAWFAYTNLNLGWRHPFNDQGLSPMANRNLFSSAGQFANIKRGFEYGGNKAMSGYVSDRGLAPNEGYVFKPLTAFGLVHGFLVRLAGEDTVGDGSPGALQAFIGRSMQKAGLIAGVSSNASTFSSQAGMVPNYTQARADEINQRIPVLVNMFASVYQQAAAEVTAKLQAGDVAGAKSAAEVKIAELERLYHTQLDDKETEIQDATKRWIPPYLYGYVAENFHPDTNKRDNPGAKYMYGKKPVLAYIGSVVHEKFVQEKGSGGGAAKILVAKAPQMVADDQAIDDKMYTTIGMTAAGDGNGYKYFFECLTGKRSACGSKITRKMNTHEMNALVTLATDWVATESLDEAGARTRNEFGLDAVSFRRLLASYWNDPAEAFRPNMFENPTADTVSIEHIVINFRILMSDPIAMGDNQAGAEKYVPSERKTAVSCVPANQQPNIVTGTAGTSCAGLVAAQLNGAVIANDQAVNTAGSHGSWPTSPMEDRPVDNSGGGPGVGPTPAVTPILCRNITSQTACEGSTLSCKWNPRTRTCS